MSQSLGAFSSRIAFVEAELDAGLILKLGTTEVDKNKLKEAIDEYVAGWDLTANLEAEFLLSNNVELVVSDVVCWVFKSATQAGIKSLFISNFTWAEIYSKLLGLDIAEVYQRSIIVSQTTHLSIH